MKKTGYIFVMIILGMQIGQAQTLLDADGVSDTYDLINSVLAPGYNVVEAPGTKVGDCDNHSVFGDHITQVFDDSLGIWVFAFHIHVDEDNDRCKSFDRQRCEIKTYDKSPDSLLAVLGETVVYRWKFKLDEGFQPSSSFTHIHQLKSVGSPDDGMPLMTLTPRKGTPDKLQLRYAAKSSQSTIHEVPLDPLKGVWVEATERVTYGEAGSGIYSLSLVSTQDSTVLMDYSSSSLSMWKTKADFIRPKWGIYRSLNDAGSLRDEIVYFANFYINEEEDVIAPTVKISTSATELSTPDFEVFIEFSEEVRGLTEDDLQVTRASLVPGSLATSDRVNYSASIAPAFTGDVSVHIPEGAAEDAAGNTNQASNLITVVEDTTAPGVTLSLADNETSPVSGEFGISISFTEVVMGFEESDIDVGHGGVKSGSLATADGKVFTASILPEASDEVDIEVTVEAGAAQDIAGNDNEAADALRVPFSPGTGILKQERGDFRIYPNPVSGKLSIDADHFHRGVGLSLIDQGGRVMHHGSFTGTETHLDLDGFQEGIYILRIITDKVVHYQQIIIR